MEEMAYMPRILRNMNEICAEMGVHAGTVRLWAEEGAPISVEGEGVKSRYSAEAAALQRWRTRRGDRTRHGVQRPHIQAGEGKNFRANDGGKAKDHDDGQKNHCDTQERVL